MAYITMKELLEAGVHFGHQTKRWNPKMKPYIFGARDGIYIIDLQQTLKLFKQAYQFILETVASGRASPEAGRRFLGNAVEDVERLQDLVEKVLEATRFGEGWSEVHREETNLSRLVEDSIETFRRRAVAENALLQSAISPNIHAEVDAEAMAIVISNLLENAVKYGGVPAAVEIGLSMDGNRAVLEVGDNGAGISDEDVGLIFGRFYRGGDEMTRTARGTGLGLYLVQQIVAAHRGKVEVASTGPSGTIFRVTVPGFET